MQKVKFQRGFTLIEMVIVIVVIGILMGLAFQGITAVQQSARDTRRLAGLNQTQVHLALFLNRCGHYPVNATPQCVTGTISTGEGTLGWDQLRQALTLVVNERDIPRDPLRDRNYHYGFRGGGVEYVLGAQMERMGNNPDLTTAVFGIPCNTLYCIRS